MYTNNCLLSLINEKGKKKRTICKNKKRISRLIESLCSEIIRDNNNNVRHV